MIYSWIKVDGFTQAVESEKPLSLRQLQELVGGLIEFVRLDSVGNYACVNEEGRLNGSARNVKYPEFFGDIVLGTMVVSPKDGEVFVGIL